MILHESNLPPLALYLINAGVLDKTIADSSAARAKTQAIPFISYLVQEKILSSDIIHDTCQKIFSLPVFDLKKYDRSSETHDLLSVNLIRQYRVVPLYKNNNVLYIGISDPTDQHAIKAIMFHTQLNVQIMLIREDDFSLFLDTYYHDQEINKNIQKNLLQQISLDENPHTIPDKIIMQDEPLIKFVDNIIFHAFQQSASDIHIESYENICRIRYRKDGILFLVNEIPPSLFDRIVTRLKVMANLNIAEKRLPQDGRFQLDAIDIRINICPALFGEKVVLRLLNSSHNHLSIDSLGLTEQQQKLFLHAINQSQGMILVTGPTGSGKTVTLYSALNYLNKSEKNISTVEDPIEIRLMGINQVNINTKIGLDFSTVLRAFLRQDPDIIMVGEIRDTETAMIAIQASQTGHLVLSTLHTNSAIETITRLRAMEIPSYNIAESFSLIIAQRLVRKLCDFCKIPETLNDDYPDFLLKNTSDCKNIYRAVGCIRCIQGYKNRIAIYECLPVTAKINKLILAEADSNELLIEAKQEGYFTLKTMLINHVLQGATSLMEARRVLQL